MKPTTTVTYSRSSPALIECQVFYSKDTVKIGIVSIAEYIFADVTDVSGQDNTNACECINSISFELRTLKRGVCRNTCFQPCFSMRVSLLVFIHAQCVMVTRQPFGRRAKSPSVKSFHSHPHIIMLSCVSLGLHARCTDVFNVFLSFPFLVWMVWSFQWHWLWVGDGAVVEQWLLWTYTYRGRGCYSGYRTQGYIAQWLERLTADQQVTGSISGWRSWFYLHDRIRQSDESSSTAVQHYEPNQNSNHNDYKKVS